MKFKQITTALLLVFVGVSVALLVVKETRSKPGIAKATGQITLAHQSVSRVATTGNDAGAESAQLAPEPPNASRTALRTGNKRDADASTRTVVAYYFHGHFRCPTCRKIEVYSREAVENGFSEDLNTGRLEWHAVNVEEAGNEHFIQDYRLFSKSLVLVAKEGSKQIRWKNLQEVWTLVGNKEAFIKYVQTEIRAYLKGD